MKTLNYILEGFGFQDWLDFQVSSMKFMTVYIVKWSVILGTIDWLIMQYLGLEPIVGYAIVLLIILEFVTGMAVSKRKGIAFKSRPFGRMLFKIGFYMIIIYILNSLAVNYDAPKLIGFDLDPFKWLYHVFFIALVFQFILSLSENLVALGFKELKPFVELLKLKVGKYFKRNNNE